jgi:CcmD family protein
VPAKRGRTPIRLRASAWLFAAAVLLAPGLTVRGFGQPPPTSPAQDEFVAVDKLPSQEELPAAPLVMIAYAAAWIVVFGYLWSIWQRLGRVEREIADVTRRVQQRPGR